jgi:hypothetical protein
MTVRAISVLLLAAAAMPASAAMWQEVNQGDLSNSGAAPSSLTLDVGSNPVSGGFGNGDLDYLTIVVPSGFALTAIVTGVANSQGLSRSFIGVQAGPVMTVPPTTGNAVGLLGWTHFGSADGVNLLPAMGLPAFGSTGFNGPLAAGSYTFWINETSFEPNLGFDLDFQMQPVPLPGAALLLAGGLGLLGGFRRRRRAIAVA